jgi:hypothetical protein
VVDLHKEIKSKIIESDVELRYIIRNCFQGRIQHLSLLYSGISDGFLKSSLRKKCEDRPNLLILAKTDLK